MYERGHRAVGTVDGRPVAKVSAPHRIIGPINGFDWMLFIGQHEARRLGWRRDAINGARASGFRSSHVIPVQPKAVVVAFNGDGGS